MNDIETNEFSGSIKDVSESIKNTLESFEMKIKNVSENFFCFLKSIAYYIFNDVGDNKTLEAIFKKYVQKYKNFCKKFSKFITFKKLSVILSQEGDADLNENIEFVFNYEENCEIVDRHKINEIVEILSKYGRSVEIRYNFTIELSEKFKELKDDVDELNDVINEEVLDSVELNILKPLVLLFIDSCSTYRIFEYSVRLTACENTFNENSLKLKKIIYTNAY